ncbi:MAG: efflux RND transporter periplasmic adaptor subunit [Sphingobacteriaceae bacterium]|nr:efflux RND transporter periplasmic adaptor subunit [Cytophagaceae bacterium]
MKILDFSVILSARWGLAWLPVVVLFACTKPGSDEEKTAEAVTTPADLVILTPEQAKTLGLQTGPFDTTTLRDEVLANGVVDVPPMYLASVSLPIGGYVRSIRKLPGSPVAKGETLLTLESMEFIQMQQDYLQAHSHLTFQQQELQRQTTLNAEEVGARRRLEQAQAEVTNTQALVRGLEAKFRLLGASLEAIRSGKLNSTLSVKAPLAGNVQHINVTLGKTVGPTDVLVELIGTAHKHLELKVFEKDAFKIQNGQKLLLVSPQFGAKPAVGSVFLVGKTLEGEAKTLNIHGHLSDPAVERRLVPGMYVAVKIQTGSRQAQTVPEEAIVSEGEARFIFVQEKPLRFRKILVKLGQTEGGQTEVFPQKPVDGKAIVRKGAYLMQASTQEAEEE